MKPSFVYKALQRMWVVLHVAYTMIAGYRRLLGSQGVLGSLQHELLLPGALQEGLQDCTAVTQLLTRFFASKRASSKPHARAKKHMLQQHTAVDLAASQQQPRQPQQQNRPSKGASSPGSHASRNTSRHATTSNANKTNTSPQPAGALPRPQPLVLPSLSAAAAAAAPVLGRVKPSSSAAAAAAAAILQHATPPNYQQQAPAADAAAAAPQEPRPTTRLLRQHNRQRRQHPHADPPARSSSSNEEPQAAQQQQQAQQQQPQPIPMPKQLSFPWELVDALPPPPPNSPLTLEALAAGGFRSYLAYMAAARLGYPTVFDLGVCREQGYAVRRHLLQREQLLGMVAQELRRETSSSGSAGSSGSSNMSASQQQQQQPGEQQQQSGEQPTGWPNDEQLQELSQQQLEAIAAAAAASGQPLLRGVTADDVAACLVDYFVFSRCIEVLLLQRQYRQGLQEKQHEQQQQQQGGADDAEPVAQLSEEELDEVKIWDAFFDCSLESYHTYLKAAAAGQPSVYTNPTAFFGEQQQQQKQQPQPQQQAALARWQAACQNMAREAHILGILPTQQLRQPGHMTKMQLAQLAVMAGEESAEGVVTCLGDFGAAKRMAFGEVLQELLSAAGPEAAGSMGRF